MPPAGLSGAPVAAWGCDAGASRDPSWTETGAAAAAPLLYFDPITNQRVVSGEDRPRMSSFLSKYP
jgi:hypothetical protein